MNNNINTVKGSQILQNGNLASSEWLCSDCQQVRTPRQSLVVQNSVQGECILIFSYYDSFIGELRSWQWKIIFWKEWNLSWELIFPVQLCVYSHATGVSEGEKWTVHWKLSGFFFVMIHHLLRWQVFDAFFHPPPLKVFMYVKKKKGRKKIIIQVKIWVSKCIWLSHAWKVYSGARGGYCDHNFTETVTSSYLGGFIPF